MITMESDRKSLGCGAALVVAAGLGLALSGVPTPAFAQEVSVQEDIDLAAAASASTLGDAGKTSLEVKSTVDEGGLPKSPTAPKHMATSNATGFDSATGEDEASELTQNAAASEKAEMPAEAVKPESGAKEASKIEATSKDELAGTTENSAEITAASKTEADAKADADKAVTAESSAPAAAKASSAPRDAWVGDSYYDGSGRRVESGWVVSANRSDPKAGLERYWIRDGRVFRGGLFEADAKAGWWAYAKSDGSVVRGRYAVGGRVYLADNDGRLWSRGWHVTGELTGGALERYYVEADHAARVGYSASGYAHYTRADGTTLRGRASSGSKVYLADNDGRLLAPGWHVTGAFSGGALQRYWIGSDHAATVGYSTSGWAHYTTSDGSVLRGALKAGSQLYFANNDGRLASGWVVTGAFSGGSLQRYWFEKSGLVARNRLVTPSEGAGYYAYATSGGTILRGSLQTSKGVYLANNDGRLLNSGGGWVVTGDYTGGALQRYWIDAATHLAKTGFFTVDGAKYYGVSGKGYVARGTLALSANGKKYVVLADNDGKMADKADANGWLVEKIYDGQQLQRYHLENVSQVAGVWYKAARADFFTVAKAHYYGDTSKGYVARGKRTMNAGVLLADNNGVLVETGNGAGWLVTGKYDGGGLQRYFLVNSGGHLYAKVGLFTENLGGKSSKFYGVAGEGYVARNITFSIGDTSYDADNDGRLKVSPMKAWVRRALNNISGQNSKLGSNYYIVVDLANFHLMVFNKGANSQWGLKYDWLCGAANPSLGATPEGTFYIGANDHSDWNWNPGREYATSGVYYCTYFFLDAGIHSTVPGVPDSEQLGRAVSHGCIRIALNNAKWIYENIPNGTGVKIY